MFVTGTVGKLCNLQDPTTTQCAPCEDDQFMPRTSNSSDMIECYTRDRCLLRRGRKTCDDLYVHFGMSGVVARPW